MFQIDHIYELFIFDDHEFITMAYLTLLDREPDPHGMNYYLGCLRMGYGKASVIVQLANSSEAGSHNNIKGLSKLIKEEKRANHWFWGLFTHRYRIERIKHRNAEELARIMKEITHIKTETEALPAMIDRSTQCICTSLSQLALYYVNGDDDQIRTDCQVDLKSDQQSEQKDIKQLTPREKTIYFQLKKSSEINSTN